MWRVIAIDRSGQEIAEREFANGEITIGRDPDRNLVLASSSVSRKHARLLADHGTLRIVDEGSANGVLVDGVRIAQPTAVSPTSRIEIAEFAVRIESEVALVAEAEPKTRLRAVAGPFANQEYEIPYGHSRIGRAEENELVFRHPSLSRRHAHFEHHRGHLEVVDGGSANGTFVNDRQVTRSSLHADDRLRVGELVFDVLEGSSDPLARRPQRLIVLIGASLATVVLWCVAIGLLLRSAPALESPAAPAIAHLMNEASTKRQAARTLLSQHRYAEAKLEADAALELDPASSEARTLAERAAEGPADERKLAAATAALSVGDRQGIERAAALLGDMCLGSGPTEEARNKVSSALIAYALDRLGRRDFPQSNWARCRAYEVNPGSRGEPAMARIEARLRRLAPQLGCSP